MAASCLQVSSDIKLTNAATSGSSNISSVFTLGNVETRVVNGLGSLLACNSISVPSTSRCESQVAKHVIYECDNLNTGVAYDTYKSEGFCGLQTHWLPTFLSWRPGFLEVMRSVAPDLIVGKLCLLSVLLSFIWYFGWRLTELTQTSEQRHDISDQAARRYFLWRVMKIFALALPLVLGLGEKLKVPDAVTSSLCVWLYQANAKNQLSICGYVGCLIFDTTSLRQDKEAVFFLVDTFFDTIVSQCAECCAFWRAADCFWREGESWLWPVIGDTTPHGAGLPRQQQNSVEDHRQAQHHKCNSLSILRTCTETSRHHRLHSISRCNWLFCGSHLTWEHLTVVHHPISWESHRYASCFQACATPGSRGALKYASLRWPATAFFPSSLGGFLCYRAASAAEKKQLFSQRAISQQKQRSEPWASPMTGGCCGTWVHWWWSAHTSQLYNSRGAQLWMLIMPIFSSKCIHASHFYVCKLFHNLVFLCTKLSAQ